MPGNGGGRRSWVSVASGGGGGGQWPVVGSAPWAAAKQQGAPPAPWKKQNNQYGDRRQYVVCQCGSWSWSSSTATFCRGCGKAVVNTKGPALHPKKPQAWTRNHPEPPAAFHIAAPGGPLLGGSQPAAGDMDVDSQPAQPVQPTAAEAADLS